MLSWTPIRYAHNGDVSIAYRVAGDGPVDLLFMGGFVSHLEIGQAIHIGDLKLVAGLKHVLQMPSASMINSNLARMRWPPSTHRASFRRGCVTLIRGYEPSEAIESDRRLFACAISAHFRSTLVLNPFRR